MKNPLEQWGSELTHGRFYGENCLREKDDPFFINNETDNL
jgi:hypothetical protein